MKKSGLHAMQDLDIKVHLADEEEWGACSADLDIEVNLAHEEQWGACSKLIVDR